MKHGYLMGGCYQPMPLPAKPYSVRRRRFRYIASILAVMVMTFGALVAFGMKG